VLGYTGLLLKSDDIPARKKEHLSTIERETLRAGEILKHLLDFSGASRRTLSGRTSPASLRTRSPWQGAGKVSRIEIKTDAPRIFPGLRGHGRYEAGLREPHHYAFFAMRSAVR